MSPRDTSTGDVLERMIVPALDRGGYTSSKQVVVGKRPGGRKHKVDAVAEKDGKKWLVSMKWQQTSGTAEQKVPFEVISLAEAVREGGYAGAYLVLGGEGWTLRDFYTGNGLKKHLVDSDKVKIVTLEGFVAKANRGEL